MLKASSDSASSESASGLAAGITLSTSSTPALRARRGNISAAMRAASTSVDRPRSPPIKTTLIPVAAGALASGCTKAGITLPDRVIPQASRLQRRSKTERVGADEPSESGRSVIVGHSFQGWSVGTTKCRKRDVNIIRDQHHVDLGKIAIQSKARHNQRVTLARHMGSRLADAC